MRPGEFKYALSSENIKKKKKETHPGLSAVQHGVVEAELWVRGKQPRND